MQVSPLKGGLEDPNPPSPMPVSGKHLAEDTVRVCPRKSFLIEVLKSTPPSAFWSDLGVVHPGSVQVKDPKGPRFQNTNNMV